LFRCRAGSPEKNCRDFLVVEEVVCCGLILLNSGKWNYPLLCRPKAIIAISGHWDTAVPSVTVASRNSTIHDFYGFPKEAYEVHTYMLRMNKLPCTFCLRRICVFFFCSLHFRRIYLLHTLVIVDGDDTHMFETLGILLFFGLLFCSLNTQHQVHQSWQRE
jgi:hypothetical protein